MRTAPLEQVTARTAGTVQVRRGQVAHGVAIAHANGKDLLGNAADESDEVGVVDVQVDGGTAGLGGVGDVGGPVRPRRSRA